MATYSIRQIVSHYSRKVPEITLSFWLLKLLTTAMGESTSDYLVYRVNPYLAVLGAGIVLTIALVIQFATKKYNTWAYWFTVVMVAIFGTMAADGLHIRLHVAYIDSTVFFAIALAIVFAAWRVSQKTLSIHTVNNYTREVFYWLAVMATFALGTAAGDYAASTAGLGYFSSGLMFIGIMAIPILLFYPFKLNEVFCFWFAYIITRPLGASFADWFGKAKSFGALGYGDLKVTLILFIWILIGVGYLSLTHADMTG